MLQKVSYKDYCLDVISYGYTVDAAASAIDGGSVAESVTISDDYGTITIPDYCYIKPLEATIVTAVTYKAKI